MDILTSIPQAPAQEITARTSRKDTRDSRVEESGSLSFSGMLEKNQERTGQVQPKPHTESDSSAGKNIATVEEKLAEAAFGQKADPTSASTTGSASENRPVMIGQMLKIQMASVSSSPVTAPIISAEAGNETKVSVAPTESAAQIDIQPTGGDGTPAASIDLSAIKAAKASQAQPIPQTAPNAGTQSTATPVPQAAGQAELRPVAGTLKTPASLADTRPVTSGSVEAAATVDKMVPEQQAKSSDTVTRTAVPAELADQIPAKVQDKGQTQGQDKINLKTLQAEPQAPTVQAIEDDGAAEDQASLSDAPGKDMASAPEMAATVEKPVNDTAAAPAAPVDTQPRSAVELPEGMVRSQMETSPGQSRVSPVINNSSTRAAALEQGNQIRQQVISRLSSSLGNNVGNQKMTLLLNPESLGQVEVQFTTSSNNLSIVMTASNGETEQALREGLKELADGIVDKAAKWQQVDIKVDNRGQDQEKNETRQDKNRDQSRRESGQGNDQEKQDRQQDGMPDWASLRQEG